MKLKTLLAALFLAGLAASFAIAAPADGSEKGKGKKKTTSTSTATTGAGTTTSAQQRYKNVQLQGTAAPATFTMTVDKSSRQGRATQSAVLRLSGRVQVVARMCGTGQAATFELKSLRAKGAKQDDD